MSSTKVTIATRASLLARLKNPEDQRSWEEFFNTYSRMIYGLATRLGLSDSEAEDALQETVIKVAEKMPGFKYDPALGSFKNWLLTIARSRIVDCHRRRRREQAHFVSQSHSSPGTSAIERIPDPATLNVDAIWEQQWKENVLEAATDRVRRRVSPKQFQLYDCNVRKDWPVEKVARVLGVSAAQVHLAKHRITLLIKRQVRHVESGVL
jgi:RNA polymerase sigma-70 factor (ECF subfamily)